MQDSNDFLLAEGTAGSELSLMTTAMELMSTATMA